MTASMEAVQSLRNELDNLKVKLEEEREKLNDANLFSHCSKTSIPNPQIRCRRVLKSHTSKVLDLDWSSDRRHIVSSSQNGQIFVWDAYTTVKQYTASLQTTWVNACAYSPSGNVIACGGLDNKCSVFPINGGSQQHQQQQASPQGNTATSSSNSSSGGGGNMTTNMSNIHASSSSSSSAGGGGGGGDSPVTCLHNKKVVAMHTSYLSACTFTESDHQLLTASGDGTCALWDVESSQLIQSFHAHQSDVMDVALSPDECGNLFISGGCDRNAIVWDMRTSKHVHSYQTHDADINTVRWFPSGETFATGSDDATIRMYDLRADREISCYRKDSVMFGVNSVDFSISGRIVFGAYNDYLIHAWDVLRGNKLMALFGHENRASCMRVSPDGTAFCTGSWDSTLRVWA